MTDNKISNLLYDYIKKAERLLNADVTMLTMGVRSFGATVDEMKHVGGAYTWNNYPICLNVSMPHQVQIECQIEDGSGCKFPAILVINDFDDIEM